MDKSVNQKTDWRSIGIKQVGVAATPKHLLAATNQRMVEEP